MRYDVLLADDDDSVRLVLSKALTRAGHTVKATDNADTLVKWATSGIGDIVLTDVMMGGYEVFERLPELSKHRSGMPVIIISANNTVNTALKSGQHKVFEYVPKPFDLNDVTEAVGRAGKTVSSRIRLPKAELTKLSMIGRSAAMQPVYRAVSRFASGDLPVLIRGAVGTGKDLVAQLLHDSGARRSRPFLRTHDFSSVSLTLQKVNGGDLYVDEVAELSADQQVALLSLMTECEQMSPSSTRPRVISSTRKDLLGRVEAGKFRDDLLYRINVAEIHIPPLSERDRDTYELAEIFLSNVSGGGHRRFAVEALDILHRHEWTGNVRELENLVRRLSVLYSDNVITKDMVLSEISHKADPAKVREQAEKLDGLLHEACSKLLDSEIENENMSVYKQAVSWIEKPLIRGALKQTGGNQIRAAEKLGIHRNTLRTRLSSLNIS
ncbi:MAG: sigma-54-dependent Fis family transcriptional regulator [Hyphomonadaceae bacterium]|nr:sigma-54-dependent Fis family transcriptional regulator [Hyphomonadaceae bacterium]